MILFVISLFLSGCITKAESTSNEEPIAFENEERIIQSYQFWNENPMSIGKETVFDQTGLLDCLVKTYNHNEGNMTITIPDIFEETFRNTTATFQTDVLANNTMRTTSSGYHDPEVSPIGDFYVVDCYLYY